MALNEESGGGLDDRLRGVARGIGSVRRGVQRTAKRASGEAGGLARRAGTAMRPLGVGAARVVAPVKPFHTRFVREPWRRTRKRFAAVFDAFLPKRFFARSLLIVILPMVLLQSVITLVFMERHWNAVTEKLSDGLVRDIAAIIEIIETYPHRDNYADVERIAFRALALGADVMPPGPLPDPVRRPFFDLLDASLAKAIGREIQRPFWIDTVTQQSVVRIMVKLEGANLAISAPLNRAYASNSHIFLVWMVTAALVLLGVAILFLRGQVRPIQRLADAAESFGRGRPTPSNFRPGGATEVRRAGLAFIKMRGRIERQLEQRTIMLTGVSHDLRTILTRFRLQLAVASPDELDPELGEELRRDLSDMQQMLEAYMDFVRGEGEEDIGELSLEKLFERCSAEAEVRGRSLRVTATGDDRVEVRPVAFTRLVMNLVSNACRHAETVAISAEHGEGRLVIHVDDDGPGIPEERIEDALRPFVRLNAGSAEDRARNQDVGGTGLGLTIARDLARSHGGDLSLSRSAMGGLRATISVPA